MAAAALLAAAGVLKRNNKLVKKRTATEHAPSSASTATEHAPWKQRLSHAHETDLVRWLRKNHPLHGQYVDYVAAYYNVSEAAVYGSIDAQPTRLWLGEGRQGPRVGAYASEQPHHWSRQRAAGSEGAHEPAREDRFRRSRSRSRRGHCQRREGPGRSGGGRHASSRAMALGSSLVSSEEIAASKKSTATEHVMSSSSNATEHAASSSPPDPAASTDDVSCLPLTGIPIPTQASASEASDWLLGDEDLEKIVALLLWMAQDSLSPIGWLTALY